MWNSTTNLQEILILFCVSHMLINGGEKIFFFTLKLCILENHKFHIKSLTLIMVSSLAWPRSLSQHIHFHIKLQKFCICHDEACALLGLGRKKLWGNENLFMWILMKIERLREQFFSRKYCELSKLSQTRSIPIITPRRCKKVINRQSKIKKVNNR